MTKRISELTQSQTLSGGELFEGVQNSTSVAVSAGEIRTFVERTSVVTAFKNQIINGDFPIWQRNTSQTSSGYGSDDRWNNAHSGSTKTHSRQAFTVGQTDVPGNPKYFSRTVVTTGSGASDYAVKVHNIESVHTLAGKTATLSFWAKADSSKNMVTEFRQYFGSGGSPSATIDAIGVTTHSLATSWQKFTVTVSIPSISGKTLGSNDNDNLSLVVWFEGGSDYNSRNNSLGNQSGTFDIAKVQLEEGKVATSFEQRPFGIELALCQRYYCKSYDLDVFPGTITDSGRFVTHINNVNSSDYTLYASWNFPVTMRDNPTITLYSPATGNSGNVRMTSGDVSPGGTTIGTNGFEVFATNGAAATIREMAFHVVASAEL